MKLPIKIGLDFFRDSSGRIITRDRRGAQSLGQRMAQLKTKDEKILWLSSIWSGPEYFRLSFYHPY